MFFLNNLYLKLFVNRNVLVLSLTVSLVIVAQFSWYPILPIYLLELGANDFQVGISYTFLSLASTMMQFFGGILSDQLGRKSLIVYPGFIFPLLFFMVAKISSWLILVLILAIVSSLGSLQLPSVYSMIAESVPKKKRAKAYSLFELFVVLGITVGPLIGMILISRFNTKYLFYFSSIITFLCTLSRMFWLTETHHHRLKINKNDTFKKLFNKKILLIIVALSSLFLLFNLTTNGPFISLFAKEIMHFTKSKINLLFALGGFSAVIFSIWGGKIIERWGSKNTLSYSALGMGIFALFWSFTKSQFNSFIFFIILYVFFQSCFIAYGALLADITHQQSRGLVIGFIGTVTGVIGSFGPSLGGYLRLHFNPISTFCAGLIFAFITYIALSSVRKQE